MPKVQKFSSVLMLTFFLVKNLFMFSVCILSYGARGKFGEHEKCVRVTRGTAESNSSFLSECLSAKICCSWSSDKFAKRATYEFFPALFLLLVGSGPKISKRRKTALQPNRTETLKPSKKKKKCSRHLIYTQACVNKDFVHSGSIGLI